MSQIASPPLPDTLGKAREIDRALSLTHAKKGLGWGLLSGVSFGLDTVLMGLALSLAPLATVPSLAAVMVGAALKETWGAIWVLLNCFRLGKQREIRRSVATTPGKLCCVAGLLGGPMAMGCYVYSVYASGPAYAVSLATLYPIFGAIFAMPILKERLQPKVLAGILICIAGSFLIAYSPADLNRYPHFYSGILAALLANAAWGLEGVVGTFGMDLLDPDAALAIRYISSSLSSLVVAIFLAGGLLFNCLTAPDLDLCFMGVGLCSSLAFLAWYKSMNMTGVARANALNNTHAMFGIFFAWLFLGAQITPGLVGGVALVLMGSMSALTDLDSLFNLRKI